MKSRKNRQRRKRTGGLAATQTSVIYQVINGTFGTSGGTAAYSSSTVVVDASLTCRPASITVDVAAPAPSVLYITCTVNGVEVFHSRDFISSVTVRRINLRCPRSVDYGPSASWNIVSSGAGVAAGSCSFTYKNPLTTA